MISELKVGPIAQADGTPTIQRASKTGATVCSDAHGRYYEAASRGKLFSGSNSAAQAVSVALATTYTGLVLSNDLNSGKYLSLLGCNFALTVAPAAIASLHLIAGYSASANITHTTPVTPRNNLIGFGAAGVGKLDSAATISTPTYLCSLGSGFTAAALYATTPNWIDLGGAFVIPPGGFIAFGALTAVTGFGSFLWEEIDI